MTTKTKNGIVKADNQAVATSQARGVLASLGARYNVDPNKLLDTLRATVFKEAKSTEQLMALCIVADQYKLNPLTKEIYAFPDKGGGIVPVVGIDGWLRIINDHPQMDGMEISGDDDQCTVTIYRKDRTHPTTVTEYASECKRNTGTWQSHPARMLRHKTIIQCGRVAFGFALRDPDEAERIVEMQQVEDRPAIAPPRVIEVAPDVGDNATPGKGPGPGTSLAKPDVTGGESAASH